MATNMVSTDFMLQLHKQLLEKTYGKEEHKLSETTASAYIRTLYILNDKKPFKSLTFLKNREEIDKKLLGYAESTQKTVVASITSVLSLYKDKPAYKALYKHYYDKMMVKSKLAGGADTSKKTETQKDNWIEWNEVLDKKTKLAEKVNAFNAKLLTGADFTALQQLVVLSLYTDVPPRRNQDYLDMNVFRSIKKDKIDELPKDKNYLVLVKNVPTKMVFNKYKTSKKYGTQTVDVPSELAKTIQKYLSFHPARKEKSYPLLVTQENSPLVQANSITRILNNIFGKKIGSSMLRHIYLSSKMDIAGMKADATAMGHSLTEQQKYLKTETNPTP